MSSRKDHTYDSESEIEFIDDESETRDNGNRTRDATSAHGSIETISDSEWDPEDRQDQDDLDAALAAAMAQNATLKSLDASSNSSQNNTARSPRHMNSRNTRSDLPQPSQHTRNSRRPSDSVSVRSESTTSSRRSTASTKRTAIPQPGRNQTFTREEMIKIQRDNLGLLSNLERIQRRGGSLDTRPSRSVNHVASSAVNRTQKQRKTAQENLAFLKRLQNVKPTLRTTGSSSRSSALPGPPRRSQPRKPKKRPEWVDISAGP